MKEKLFYTFMLLCLSIGISAQQLTVNGLVTDSKDGSPMPGVNVIIENTSKGVVTDIDGKYNINVDDAAATLSFSFVGYVPQKVAIDGRTSINVALEPAVTGLDEIIVIGYGTQKKSDKTGAVVNVTASELNQGVLTDPIQGLQGKAAGVMITKKGGDPSAGFSVKIRGQASFFSSTEPLYVIDGVPGVDPTTIAPEDIESFNILKDASSSAIYGSRASSGVILITTKRGKAGVSSVSYNGYVSIDQVANRLDLLSASDIRTLLIGNKDSAVLDGGANTDWQDEIYRTGISQSHNINFSGGNEATTYSASLTHNPITGIVKGTKKVRDIGRISLVQKAIDNKLTVTASLSGTLEHNDYIQYDGYGTKDVFFQALQRNPTDPVRNADGTYYETSRGFNYTNPLNLIDNIQNQRDAKRYLGNLRLDFEITKSLSTSLNLAYTRDDNENFYFVPLSFYAQPEGEGRRQYDNKASSILEYTINYNHIFNDVHTISLVGGYSYQEDVVDGFKAQGKNPLSNYVQSNNLAVLTTLTVNDAISSYKESNKLISFFGRAAYNYNSKYYLTGTVRQDGSTKFGSGNKWGIFPSASIAWNAANEEFIKSGLSQINQLKLRIGWGLAGNQNFDRYNSLTSVGVIGTAKDPDTGKDIVSFSYLYNSNPQLKWEENEELNIGLDYGLFDNRISGSFEYYRKKTHDLLAKIDAKSTSDIAPKTWVNAGQIDNNGFEANLQVFVVNKKNITWKSVFTYSTNKQKVVSLESPFRLEGDINAQGNTGVKAQKIQAGYELGTFYGLKYAGLTNTGLFQFRTRQGDTININTKVNGKPIDFYNDSLRQPIGNALPKYEFGFSNYFTFFKNIDFSFSVRGVMGFDILNATKMVFSNPTTLPSLNGTRDALTEIKNGLTDTQLYSDYYIEDGSFVRLDNITLGYTFDLKGYKYIKSCRVYTTASNLLTITNYTGVDPEISYSGMSFGIDNFNVYPKATTVTFGLNLTF